MSRIHRIRHADRTLRRKYAQAEVTILILYLAATLAWRVLLIHLETVNPDEVFLIGGAFRVNVGLLPYLDYIEAHTPLMYKLYAPLVGAIGERTSFLDCFRWIHFVWAVLFQVVLFVVVNRSFGTRVALWSVCILNSFVVFIERTVHVRPDLPAYLVLIGSCWPVLARNRHARRARTYILVAVGCAVAFSLHVSLVLPIAAVFIWVHTRKWVHRSFWRAVGWQLLSVGLFAVCYLGICLGIFGSNVVDAVRTHADTFLLNRAYLSSFEVDSFGILRSVVLGSLLPWMLLGYAVCLFNCRWLRRGLGKGDAPFYVLLADSGIVFLLTHSSIFEQHYFSVVIFGSVVAALAVRECTYKAHAVWTEISREAFSVAMALILVASSLWNGILTHLHMKKLDMGERTRVSMSASHDIAGDHPLNPDGIRRWIGAHSDFFDPFYYRPKQQRLAQIRFLLNNSKPGEIVYSDWCNPPYRLLPVEYHHGFMMSLFYGSDEFPRDSRLARIVRRYDPYYSIDDRSETEHMVRLLQATKPTLLLLDGSMGKLFFLSDTFSRWVSDRYTLILDHESESVFAVLR